MLNDIWKRGVEISEISTQAGMKMPAAEVSIKENLSTLINAMLQNGVTSILVTENQKQIGVVSDREILAEIAEKRSDPERIRVGDIEYTPLITLDKGMSTTDVLKIMHNKGIKRAVMVKDDKLIGMLTER